MDGDLQPRATGPSARLRGLDLRVGEPVAICLGTAAAAFGFDTEDTVDLHVLTPAGHQLRAADGLVVHRREGAPLTVVDGRLVTEPAWTAVEVARGLRRPRALATLDAALRSGACDNCQLAGRSREQRGGAASSRCADLSRWQGPSGVADGERARLVMLDGGLPAPVLQHEIVDRNWRTWRVDFAWPDALVAVEYDGFDWHSDPEPSVGIVKSVLRCGRSAGACFRSWPTTSVAGPRTWCGVSRWS